MLFELQGINQYYGQFHSLKDVSVKVEPGAIGLLGPNGAGKTTFLKTLLGLLEPDSGSGSVLERPIGRRQVEIRRRVGYMPENECFFGAMNGFESVAFAAQLSGLPRKHAIRRAHEVLDYAGLDEARYRAVEEYSTGMKQRVKLAQALVHGPELVLLDEPTNGLDPQGRDDMLSLIGDLRKIPVSVVLSSHLLNDVERVCDNVLVLIDGRVRHHGSIAEFTAGQAGEYRIEVKQDGQNLAEGLTRAGFEVQYVPEQPDRLLVTIEAGGIERLWRASLELGVQIRHLAPERISLEKAFMRFLEAP